jgi:transcriptional regulator with XRE-family HTH domain
MLSQEAIALRRRIMGVLLRNAREQARKSKKECAEVLGCSPALISAIEYGNHDTSLPQLEMLAQFLRIPVTHFLSEDVKDISAPKLPSPEIIPLRRRIIGALLRQARLDAGKSEKECADLLGCSSARITAYELGQRDIPLFELEALAGFLGVLLANFLDEEMLSVAREEASPGTSEQLAHLPADIREFVIKPTNVLYLRVAMKLSALSAETLRQIAEGLLDITY